MPILQLEHFDLSTLYASGQCFRMKPQPDGAYRVLAGSKMTTVTPLGEHRWQFDFAPEDAPYWQRYFDLGTDYAPLFAEIPAEEAYLRQAAACCEGLRILRQEPFETLISFICSQRKSIPAIRDCVERLCAAYGTPMAQGEFAFPTAQRLAAATEAELRTYGLGYRAPYVLGTARLVAEGRLDLSACAALSDAALQEQLLACPGVGVKVAGCVMLFAYHRLASAPVDVWIQKVIEEEYHGKTPFPAWGGRAGWYQQILFYYRQHVVRQ